MNGPAWIPLFSSLVAGVLLCLLSYRYLVDGARIYRESFLQRVEGDLKDAFILLDPRLLFVIHVAAMAVATLLGWALFGIVGGVGLLLLVATVPRSLLGILRRKRMDLFVYQLPDALSAIASSLRAGTNLARALEQVAEQQPRPTSQEFSVVLSEYKVGQRLEDALDRMHRRIPRTEVELMNSAIAISRAVGGNLADTLETLAATLREKAQIEGKIDALTAMGRMQGWVVGLLPIGVGAMLFGREPEAMAALFDEPVGWAVLVVVGIMMYLAFLMIRKIVNIDV